MNTKQAFQHVRTPTGQAFKQITCASDPTTFASNLILISFMPVLIHCFDFSAECDGLLDSLPLQELNYESLLTRQDVYSQLIKCKPNKAPGPDGIPGRVLKSCALELTPILRSLCTSTIPVKWKSSIVIPVPKNMHPSELNHYGLYH